MNTTCGGDDLLLMFGLELQVVLTEIMKRRYECFWTSTTCFGENIKIFYPQENKSCTDGVLLWEGIGDSNMHA